MNSTDGTKVLVRRIAQALLPRLEDTMRQRYLGLAILPAHDPGAADRLAQATGQTPELASA